MKKRFIQGLLPLLPSSIRHKLIRSKVSFPQEAPANMEIKMAETIDEHHQAFSLVHQCYVEMN